MAHFARVRFQGRGKAQTSFCKAEDRRSTGFEKSRVAGRDGLPPDQRHYPSREENSAYEQSKAVKTVAHLLDRRIALRDAKHHRSEQREHNRSREVRQVDGHGFFPSAM